MPRATLVSGLAVASAKRKLTLLAAPPGAGKTTLLSEWHEAHEEERPFAWLSLDRGDNDPVRFWSGVIEAVRTVEPRAGASALATVRMSNVGLPQVVVPRLINDLVALERHLVLVLDDYQVVHEPRVHESVEALLEHLPESVHLAIATRADPPLPLARLRARGELTEIRAPQLRFDEREASALLNGALGLDLAPGDVTRLQRRTEGWAAGLYLAALSLRGRDDPEQFITSFAGDDRQIVDYLASEVLSVQDEELRDFLLRTSILGRLSGPVCDAITGRDDSARTLERMERSNLFLVPLDDTRDWYRYHQLFGELLRHELGHAHPAQVGELHRRAARWYREQGSIPDAIQHFLAAGDPDEARELVVRHWSEYFNQGRLDTVASWLDALPGKPAADPRLCIARAWLALDRGRVEEASVWIDAADAGGSVEAHAAVLRAVHRFKTGDLGGAERAARRTLGLVPEEGSFTRGVAHTILGVALYWRGQLPRAVEALREAERLTGESDNDLGRHYALGYLALARVELGEPAVAERHVDAAEDLGGDAGVGEHFVTMVGHLARGRTAELAGKLEEAERETRRAVELSTRGAGRVEIAAARLALAQVRQARGDRAEAGRLLREARAAVEGSADAGTVVSAIGAAERGRRQPVRGSGLPDGGWGGELTDRELAVLRLLRSDLSRREIASTLYVTLDTVKTHMRGIYRKLDAGSREEAVARARELGLL